MPETLSPEEKEKKLQEAFDAFMSRLRDIEHDQLNVMKRVIGDLEREEIQRVIDSLKE